MSVSPQLTLSPSKTTATKAVPQTQEKQQQEQKNPAEQKQRLKKQSVFCERTINTNKNDLEKDKDNQERKYDWRVRRVNDDDNVKENGISIIVIKFEIILSYVKQKENTLIKLVLSYQCLFDYL